MKCSIIRVHVHSQTRSGSRISSKGAHLRKIAPSGGRREIFWGISCEKSRFYAKNHIFSNFRGTPPPPPGFAPVNQCSNTHISYNCMILSTNKRMNYTSVLFSHGPNKYFLEHDSCRSTVRNCNSINTDLTEDTTVGKYRINFPSMRNRPEMLARDLLFKIEN